MKLEVAGTHTNYQVMGKGPNLVLLHGWAHNWQTWSPIINELSKKFSLIIPDLPGFGQSSYSGAWSTYEYATWLQKFITKTTNNKTFFLLGHSFGGKIACVFAAQNPQKLSKLIVVDASGIPVPLDNEQKLKQNLISLIPSGLKNKIPHKLKAKILQQQGLATDSLNASQQQKDILKKILQENITEGLKKIKVSTLLIWGANDQETPLDRSYLFNSAIKKSRLKVFEKSGHFPYLDEPSKFIETVVKFLSK